MEGESRRYIYRDRETGRGAETGRGETERGETGRKAPHIRVYVLRQGEDRQRDAHQERHRDKDTKKRKERERDADTQTYRQKQRRTHIYRAKQTRGRDRGAEIPP